MSVITFEVKMLLDDEVHAAGTLNGKINGKGNVFCTWSELGAIDAAFANMALQITAMPSNRATAAQVGAWYKANSQDILSAAEGKVTGKVEKVDTAAILAATLRGNGGNTTKAETQAKTPPPLGAIAHKALNGKTLTDVQLADYARATAAHEKANSGKITAAQAKHILGKIAS